jgi:hypothetical protein
MPGEKPQKTKGKMIRSSDDLEMLREIIDAHPTTKMKVLDVIRKTLGIQTDEAVQSEINRMKKK